MDPGDGEELANVCRSSLIISSRVQNNKMIKKSQGNARKKQEGR